MLTYHLVPSDEYDPVAPTYARVYSKSRVRPRAARARAGWAAQRRVAAAMFDSPRRRRRPMARLRKAAMHWGAVPARTWERSSSKVTSRTQCSLFSMV